MGEVEKAPDSELETETAAESPEPSLPEGASPWLEEGLEVAVIEGLAEEDTVAPPLVVPEESPPKKEPESDRLGLADTAPMVEAIKGLGEKLTRRLDSLQTLMERELRAEVARERVVDRLHAELQEYKQDLLLKVQRPIFLDLIQLHDDIGKMMEVRPPDDTEPERAAAVRGILESIRTAIEDILYRQGVEPFAAEGDGFDPRRQRAVSTVPTDDPARNKTIAGRLRKGFQAGEKLIRPEIVSVFTLRPPRAPAADDRRVGSAGESEPVPPQS